MMRMPRLKGENSITRQQGMGWRGHEEVLQDKEGSRHWEQMVVVFVKQEIQEAITFQREDNTPFKTTRYITNLLCRSSLGQNIKISDSLQHHNALGTTLCHLIHVKCAYFATCTIFCLFALKKSHIPNLNYMPQILIYNSQ